MKLRTRPVLAMGLSYLAINEWTARRYPALAGRVVFGSLAFYGLLRLWLDEPTALGYWAPVAITVRDQQPPTTSIATSTT